MKLVKENKGKQASLRISPLTERHHMNTPTLAVDSINTVSLAVVEHFSKQAFTFNRELDIEKRRATQNSYWACIREDYLGGNPNALVKIVKTESGWGVQDNSAEIDELMNTEQPPRIECTDTEAALIAAKQGYRANAEVGKGTIRIRKGQDGRYLYGFYGLEFKTESAKQNDALEEILRYTLNYRPV